MDDLTAIARLAKVANDFATCADRGEAMQAMRLLTADFEIGTQGESKPRGALANVLMVRQVANWETRHHCAQPTLHGFGEDWIDGIVPVVSYKKDGPKTIVAANEFHFGLVLRDGAWKVRRLRMLPFAELVGEHSK